MELERDALLKKVRKTKKFAYALLLSLATACSSDQTQTSPVNSPTLEKEYADASKSFASGNFTQNPRLPELRPSAGTTLRSVDNDDLYYISQALTLINPHFDPDLSQFVSRLSYMNVDEASLFVYSEEQKNQNYKYFIPDTIQPSDRNIFYRIHLPVGSSSYKEITLTRSFRKNLELGFVKRFQVDQTGRIAVDTYLPHVVRGARRYESTENGQLKIHEYQKPDQNINVGLNIIKRIAEPNIGKLSIAGNLGGKTMVQEVPFHGFLEDPLLRAWRVDLSYPTKTSELVAFLNQPSDLGIFSVHITSRVKPIS